MKVLSRIGWTGRIFEEEVFGRCRCQANGYKTYLMAMAEVVENQLWDPSDPAVRFANDLHAEIALAIGLEDWSVLRLYSAVGSALDRYHGVDAFVVLGRITVTLDASLDRAKRDHGYRADFIVPPEAVEDAEARGELARAVAAALAR